MSVAGYYTTVIITVHPKLCSCNVEMTEVDSAGLYVVILVPGHYSANGV